MIGLPESSRPAIDIVDKKLNYNNIERYSRTSGEPDDTL
jgi:hypothetical protein